MIIAQEGMHMLPEAGMPLPWLKSQQEQEREPDWVCPHCRTDWYDDRHEAVWSSEGMTLPRSVQSHPQVTDGCAACAHRRATGEQLRAAVRLAGLQGALLESILGAEAGCLPESEALRDAADAVFLYMPDAYADAAREALEEGTAAAILRDVMKKQPCINGGMPPEHTANKGGMNDAQRYCYCSGDLSFFSQIRAQRAGDHLRRPCRRGGGRYAVPQPCCAGGMDRQALQHVPVR
jgi:hypothetical protein